MENKKRKQKNLLAFYPLLALLFVSFVSYPLTLASGSDNLLPQGPEVLTGAPTITTTGKDMVVNANQADKTWINWNGGFNIGAENSVTNIGPSASAVILHNDVSGAISNIQGALNGNCNVFLLNPSGILFGAGAQVNVGGLVVSTMRMSMDDFMSGNYLVKQEPGTKPGLIVNAGEITANGPLGVSLVGGAVRNEGIINANLSTVNLVSGSEVTLNVNNTGSIQVVVDKKVLSQVHDQNGHKVNIGVDNVGEINANGGKVYIEAEAMQNVFETLINQEGVVKAGSMVNKDGKIILISNSEGVVQNTGILDVSGVEDGASGGSVEMSGSTVGQLGTIKADAKGAGNGGTVTLYGGDITVLSPDSLTTANADTNGKGGTVTAGVLNSDNGKILSDATLFYNGAGIEAKGGSLFGDGGFVEISGDVVQVYGLVDTSVVNGQVGILLLDPDNITINDTDLGGTWSLANPYTYTAGIDGSQVSHTIIETNLSLGDVIITTGGGDITVTSAISSTSAHALTISAEDNLNVNAGISTNGAITLIGDSSGGNGKVNINNSTVSGSSVYMRTGAYVGADAVNLTGSTITSSGAVTFEDGVTLSGANTVTSGNNVTFGSSLNGAGSLAVNATSGTVYLNAVSSTAALTFNSSAAQFTGNITAASLNAGSVGLITVTAPSTTITTTGAVNLGTVTGNDLVIDADTTVTLGNAEYLASLTVSDATTLTFGGNFKTAGAVTVSGTDSVVVNSAIQAGGIVNLSATNIDINNLVSGSSVTLNTTGGAAITLSNNLTATGAITISDPVTLDGSSIVTSTGGSVGFAGDISGANSLTVNASDTATFSGTIGAGSDPTSLTVTAAHTNFNGAVNVGNFRVNGSGGTTTISSNITSADDIIIEDGVIINGANITLTSGGAAGNDILITGTINAAAASTDSLTLVAGSGNVTLGNSVGDSLQLEDLTITSTGTTTLNNTINVNGNAAGEDIDLNGATHVVLGSDLTLNSTRDVILNAVNGQGHNLTVIAGGTINLTAAVTNVLNVAMQSASSLALDFGVTALQNATFTVTGSGSDISITAALNAGTSLRVTTAGAAGDDITIGAGNDLESPTVLLDAGAGTVTVNTAINNSDGSIRILGGTIDINNTITAVNDLSLEASTITDGYSLTAGNNLTIIGAVTMDGATLTLASTNGNINLSGISSLQGAYNSLVISAANGTIYAGPIGTSGSPVASLTLTAKNAQLGGNIYAYGTVNTSGVGLTTLTASTVNIVNNGGLGFNLGPLAGANNLILSDTSHASNVNLSSANIASLTINGSNYVNFNGNFITSGAINVNSINNTITITDATGSIQAGGAVILSAATVTNNELISGDSVSITGSTAINLAGNVNSDNGLTIFNNAVTLTGASIISSANGNVTFASTINGAQNLTVNGLNGTTTFSSAVGGTTPLASLAVNAKEAILNGNISTDGGTNADIDFRGTPLVTLTADITLDTASTNAVGGDVLFGIDSAIVGAHSLTINAAGTGTKGTLQINDANVNQFTITAASVSTATLYGTIKSVNAISLSGASTVTLADAVTLITTGGENSISINTTLNGAYNLTVVSTGDVTFNAMTQLTDLTVTAGGTVHFGGAVSIPGNISVTAQAIEVEAAVHSTDASIIFTGTTTLSNAAFSAGQNITLNSAVTLGTNVTLTATHGNIDLNANVSGAHNLTLSAANGTVYVTTIGVTTPVSALVINANAAQIDGNISAVSVNTTGVDLTTLTNDATITVSGAAGILLGDLTGAKNLTLTASDAAGVVTLLDANISSLNITDAVTVSFNGNFVTSGSASVTAPGGTITITDATGSIQAGGAVTLSAATVTNNELISGNSVSITGSSAINLAGNVNSNNGLNIFNNALTLTGDSIISSANGNVTLGAVNGPYNLSVSADNGIVTLGGIIGGTTGINALTVTAGTLIDVNAAITDADSVTFNGNSDIGANITATAGAVTLNGAINTISGGARTLTASTDIDINGDISGAFSLTLTSTNNVYLRTVGLYADPTSLDINTATLYLEGNITVDGAVTLNGATSTILSADVTIDTTGGADGTVVNFAALSGNHSLTITGGDADISFTGITQLTGLTVSSSDTIDFTGAVSMPGSINVTAGTAAVDDIDVQNTIDSTAGSVTFNGSLEVNANISAGESITVNGITTLAGGATRTLTADNGSINLNGAVNGTVNGASGLTLTADNGTVYAQGIGTSLIYLGALDINADYAQLNGSIYVTSVDTTGVGLTTLTNNVNIIASGTGTVINLGDLAGQKTLALYASNASGGDIVLANADIGALYILSSAGVLPRDITFNGDFVTSDVVDVHCSRALTVNNSVQAGRYAYLEGNTVTNNGTVLSRDAYVFLVGNASSAAVSLSGNVSGNGNVTINGPTVLTGDSTVSSLTGNIEFIDDISGGFDLEADALGGRVIFSSTIGAGDLPTVLTVNADNLTLTKAVNVKGNIDVNANSVTFASGSGTIVTSTANGYIDFGTALMDAASGATIALSLDSGSGNVVLGTIGSSDPLASLAVISTGITTLNGNITADGTGADVINLGAATGVNLASNVTLRTTGAGDITINGGAIDGSYAFTVISGEGITTGAIGQNTTPTSISMIAAGTITSGSSAIDVGGDMKSSGALTLIATSGDINVGGNLVGHDVSVNAVTGTTTIAVAQDNISGSTTLKAGTSIDIIASVEALNNLTLESSSSVGADLTAGDDLTINGVVTLDADVTFTSTNGDIDLNADVQESQNLTLSAVNGTIYASTIGSGASVGALVLTGKSAELGGDISAASVDTTGVDLTILTSDVTITASDTGTAINLGDMEGNNNLTLTADGTGDIEINDADIASLTITAANNVTFNAELVTSGEVDAYSGDASAITGTITVLSSGSIRAGGTLTLQNTDNDSGTGIVISGPVSASGDITIDAENGDVAIDAEVSTSGASSIYLTAAAGNVNVAQNAAASVISSIGSIEIYAGTNVLVGSSSYAGQLITTGTGNINIDAVSDVIVSGSGSQVNAGGAINIGQNTTPGTLTITNEGLLKAAGDINATAGTITEESDTSITSGSGDIVLETTDGDMDLSGTTSAVGNSIYLNSYGAITDGESGSADIIANALYLTSSDDIGASDNYLDTKVNTIDDYSGSQHIAGDLYISEYDGVDLGGIYGLSTTDGHVFVESNATADGTLIATSVIAGGNGDIHLTSQIGQSATGNINDISIGLVTAEDNDVYLDSNHDIIDLSVNDTVSIVADGLYLAANGSVGAEEGYYPIDTQVEYIDDLDASHKVHENIYIVEYDGVNLGSRNGLTTDAGNIYVAADYTAAGTLTATSVTAEGDGNIYLRTLDGGLADNDIVVGLVTASGDDVTLISDANITDGDDAVDVVASALYLKTGLAVGTITDYLDTRVSTIDDYSDGNVGTNLYINEYDGATLGSLNTSTGLSTANGEIRIIGAASAAGDLTATLLTAGGTNNNIYLTTLNGGSGQNSIGLGLVTAADDDVILISDWNITDSGADSASDVVADGLYLDALGSVGTSTERVETTVNTIDDRTTTDNVSGNIYIGNTTAVSLGTINGLTTDAGLIDITAAGDMTTGIITANGGYGINFYATAGDIIDTVGGLITASGISTLKASGTIGTTDNPYDVNVDGELLVWSGAQVNEVSVILRGSVNSGTHTERVEIFEPTPPGLVMLNNRLMGGGNYGSGSSNGSSLNRGYGDITTLTLTDMYYCFYDRALHPWSYKMSLPWVLSQGAIINTDFLRDPPATVDISQLNINIPVPLQTGLTSPQANYYVISAIK
jgi:filamentous hemagglutinin family protein